MLLSWPNSTLANYFLFQKRKKERKKERKLVAFGDVKHCFSNLFWAKTHPSKAQHGSIWSCPRTKAQSVGELKKKTAIPREYSGHPCTYPAISIWWKIHDYLYFPMDSKDILKDPHQISPKRSMNSLETGFWKMKSIAK